RLRLQRGMREVETTTASRIHTPERMRTPRPHTGRTPGYKPIIPAEKRGVPRRCLGRGFAPLTTPDVDLMDQDTVDARIEQDEQGVITDWTAGAERLFGWTRAQAMGQPSKMLIPLRNHDRHERSLRTLPAAP